MGLLKTTNIHLHETKSVPYVKTINQTTHEHRAPTDKSVELLNEMQDKARKNIILQAVIDDNIFKGAVVVFYDELFTDSKIFHCRFTLNGVEYTFEEKIKRRDWQDQISGEDLVKLLFERFSKAIAKQLIMESENILKQIIKQ